MRARACSRVAWSPRAAAVAVDYVADGREAARAAADAADPFGAGKRRMAIMRRRAPFLMACPAGPPVRVLRLPRADARVELPDGLRLTAFSRNMSPTIRAFRFMRTMPTLRRTGTVATQYAAPCGFASGTGELADSLAFDS